MSKNKKSLQDLTLLDRFLFAEVMEDSKTFENILSIILGEVDFSNMKDCYSIIIAPFDLFGLLYGTYY